MTEGGSVSSQLPPPGQSWPDILEPSAMTTRPNWLERRCFEGNEKQFLLETSLRGVSLAQSRGNIQEELCGGGEESQRRRQPAFDSVCDKRSAKEFSGHEQRMSQTGYQCGTNGIVFIFHLLEYVM